MANNKLDTSIQVLRLKDFSGGWASVPGKMEEAEVFTNLEITREKDARTCFGSTTFNSTNISVSGTYSVHSLGAGGAGANDFVILAGTSQGKVWSATSQTAPVAFTDRTGAAALTGTYWSFTQFVDASDNRIMVFGNELDGMWYWDGSSNIAQIAAAPDPCVITNYQGYLFAAVQPNSLYFSDYLDYATWPGASIIEFSMDRGKITGLATLPDKLLIFFQRGVGMITGRESADFSGSFTLISNEQGTIYPLTVSAYGSEVAMHTTNGPVIVDATGASSEYIGEPLREWFLEDGDAAINQDGWKGVLTPFHYVLIKRVSPASSSRAFIYDRAHKAWSKLSFPTTSFATSAISPGYIKTA